jgi:glycosyltransferase involved in cell wall biosynthesis
MEEMRSGTKLAKVPEKVILSVVVLCYRAEEYIINFVEQLTQELREADIQQYELVLVANYDPFSKDKTPKIVKQLAGKNPRIVIVAEEKKGKMGWDMRSGLSAACGEYIAIIDGDGQMPVSDICVVYNIIKGGDYDLVKTFRAKRGDGFFRTIVSKTYNLLFKMLFWVPFPVIDINSKPKILTRSALDAMELKSNDWFTDSEIMIEAYRNNLRICEVSTSFKKNVNRASFVNVWTIFEFISNLLYYRVMLFFK